MAFSFKKMASQSGKAVANIVQRQVKPFLSNNPAEARLRVLNLYRAWFRAVPKICEIYRLPANPKHLRARIKEEFLKNSHIQDVRAIDHFVVKGRMELQETMEHWKQQHHIMGFIKHDSRVPEQTDFLGKFFAQK